MSEQFSHNENPAEINPSDLDRTVYVRRSSGEISTMRMVGDGKADLLGRSMAFIVERDEESGEEHIAGWKPLSRETLTDRSQHELATQYEASRATIEQGERDVLPVTAEKFGAIGLAASGVDDPSAINEHAVLYSRGELGALRAAALEKSAMEQQSASLEVSTEVPETLATLTEGLSVDDLLELRRYADAKKGKAEAQRDGDGERSTLEGQFMGQALRAMSPRARAVKSSYAALYEQS